LSCRAEAAWSRIWRRRRDSHGLSRTCTGLMPQTSGRTPGPDQEICRRIRRNFHHVT
jgi:hypothetical protein